MADSVLKALAKVIRMVLGVSSAGGVALLLYRLKNTTGRTVFRRCVTVQAEPSEAFALWQKTDNLAGFFKQLRSAERRGDRVHLAAHGPWGQILEWDLDIVEEKPGKVIGWLSDPSTLIEHAANIRFQNAPSGRGTVVTLEVHIDTEPIGSALIFAALGEWPARITLAALQRFKQRLETGEVTTTEGQPTGHRSPVGNLRLVCSHGVRSA